MLVIQVRGTSGSGKTWVMQQVMERLGNWAPRYVPRRKRPLWYRLIQDYPAVVVLGGYDTACGGCDSVGSAAAVYDLIQKVQVEEVPNVILAEGLLLSEDAKWTAQLLADGLDLRVAYLTTAVERCITQINTRRAAAGRTELANVSNTTRRVAVIERSRVKLEAAGVHCVQVTAPQATAVVNNWVTRFQRTEG